MATSDCGFLQNAEYHPFVTVAIPTFNRASWLAKCVPAALAQSYQHFEVLVSDNASTDSTAALLRTLANPRLRVLTQRDNIGQMPNWNACLAEAKGDYIVFVSDDDVIAPWLLERCMTLVTAEPQIALIVALGDVYLAESDLTLPAVSSRTYGTGVWNGVDILREFLKGHLSAQMCTVVMRTALVRARGGLPTDWPHTADLATWVPLLLSGRVGLVNERCGTYCDHNASLTSNLSIDVRFRDLQRLTNLINRTAATSQLTLQQRREITLQTERYLARHALGYLVSLRRSGTALSTVIPAAWNWRRHLASLGTSKVSTLPWLLPLLLPRPLMRVARRILDPLIQRRRRRTRA